MQYDTLADVYDFLVPDALLTPAGAAAAFAEYVSGDAVLDCACGTGQLAVGLALAGRRVAASDASEAMVSRTRALAAAHGVELRAQVRTWEALEPAGFDTVLCVGNSLAHAQDRVRALRGMARALRPGGSLVITSRNWERVRANGSGLEVAGGLVEREGRQGLVIRAWEIRDAWEEPHRLDTAVALIGDGDVRTVSERLTFWPFTHERLGEDLRTAGLTRQLSSYEPGVDRYVVVATAGG